MRNVSNLLKFCLPLLTAIIVACPQNTTTPPAPTDKTQPSPTISKVDTTLVPISAPVVGVNFSSVKSASGVQADFISNELIVGAASRQIVDAFAQRIGGSVEQATDEVGGTGLYRVKVSNPKGNVADLAAQLTRNTPFVRDELSFSSEQALNLVALAATENGQAGLTVALNWVMQPTAEQATAEQATVTTADERYKSNNARDWEYMRNDGLLDIGVVGAWNRLAGLNTRTKVAVFDGGFRKSADLPADTVISPNDGYNRANPAKCGNDSCPWHGLMTSTVLAGIEDNNIGIAGSAGRYAALRLVPSGNSVLTWFEWTGALIGSVASGNRIFNISAGTDVPATLFWTVEGPWNLIRIAINAVPGAKVPLVIASAGNNGLDVDRQDCFSVPIVDIFVDAKVVCWESVVVVPCELTAVLCVGGTDNWKSRDIRAPNSAYGSKSEDTSVDIFAPYSYWTLKGDPATPDNNAIKYGSGTSFSAPFVSGVAAMVMAANPNLNGDQVQDVIKRTAHPAGGEIRRFINADAAVREVLGPQQPRVTGVLANQATRNRPYTVTLLANGQLLLFGAGAFITTIDPNSRDGTLDALTLNVVPPAGWALTRTDARTVQITPNADGNFTINYSVVGQKSTNQSFNVLVQAPTAALIVHPGLGTSYIGGEYYATAKAYEQDTFFGTRKLLPCSQIKWEITSSSGVQTVASSNGGLSNCLLKTSFTQAQQVTIQAKVVDIDGSTIKQSSNTVITVLDAPTGSNPGEIKLTSNGFGGTSIILNPRPTYLNYECGNFSEVILGGSASILDADRVKHQIVNAASGLQLTPAAEPSRYSNPILLNPGQNIDTVLTVAELNSLNLGGIFPWYGRHTFSLLTLERDGMTFMRPAVIDVIASCPPR
jgi:hypothetical protein